MRFQRSIQLLLCTGLAASAVLTAAATMPEGAAGAASLSVTCTTMTGTVTSEGFSSCSGTGKSLTGTSGTLNVGTKTIKWKSGQTSKVTASYKTGSDAACPNVSKYTKDTLETWVGKVTSGALNGSAFSGSACIYKAVAAPHSLITKNKGSVKI
jgi:hypothetical protein